MKIVCTLPNASEEISGIKFTKQEDGSLVSVDLASDVAEVFLSIPGYFEHDDGASADPQPAAVRETAAQKKARLKAEADAAAATEPAQEEAAPVEVAPAEPATTEQDSVF